MDQAFDDPVRRPPPRQVEKKPLEEVSTEKSTKSLGEIYEDEYMMKIHNYDKQKEELDGKKVRLEKILFLIILFLIILFLIILFLIILFLIILLLII